MGLEMTIEGVVVGHAEDGVAAVYSAEDLWWYTI
jgi:hypothetical protein